jgi:hypothetical protein
MHKRRENIPDHFTCAEEAGEFWDTHSAADYLDEMVEEEIEFDIQKRTFLVQVSDRIYKLAKKKADAEHISIEKIINNLLDRELAEA